MTTVWVRVRAGSNSGTEFRELSGDGIGRNCTEFREFHPIPEFRELLPIPELQGIPGIASNSGIARNSIRFRNRTEFLGIPGNSVQFRVIPYPLNSRNSVPELLTYPTD